MSDDEHICGVCFVASTRHRDRGQMSPRCCFGCPCGTTQPLDPGDLSLNDVLSKLGYRTETITDARTGMSGKNIIHISTNYIAHHGSADSTWKWLRKEGLIR